MDYLDKYREQVETFVSVCRLLGQRIYITSYGGNLCTRLEDDLLLITPTCVYKGNLEPEDLVFINLKGEILEGSKKPSGETPMYLNFFKERPDINSVIHCHPPYTNAFVISQGKNWLERPVFPETILEVGPVPVVPYGEPLTQELADNFLPFLQNYNAFLMESHGLTIMCTGDIMRAFELTDILESSSISILQALAIGDIKELPVKALQELENTIKARNLPMVGAPGANKSLVSLYYPEK